ncbi:Uncharacterised protein [Legionella wadsworthii]|uniref:Uncharacterized protein n=1 Tax=Legionella wadsworthii TaxID=28088 RepID=A0A378LSJ8_9GAMM|nr:Uncharacterised protein [Legionella wadsworthii]
MEKSKNKVSMSQSKNKFFYSFPCLRAATCSRHPNVGHSFRFPSASAVYLLTKFNQQSLNVTEQK